MTLPNQAKHSSFACFGHCFWEGLSIIFSSPHLETWLDIVPKELSRLFHKLLNDSGELEAECIGNRVNAGEGKGVKSLWTTDLWPMISMWEGSRGNYLRRTLLMIWTSVEFSKSQKAQRDKKEKRSLFIHIYHLQAKTIDGLYLKDLSLQMISHWLEKLK